MHKIIWILTIAISVGLVTTGNTYAGWGNSDREGRGDDGYQQVRVSITFSESERKLIHQYYRDTKQKMMPPGLAKKRKLPPGLQKQIKKNGKLPPGLEGRYLPYDLERNLHRLPKDYVRIRLGNDILLIELPTQTILDVISAVVF